ncbi:MAG: type III-B CRISPR-associated protein Cas10/Cmr2 [Actinobacteria bacterium]|nr:type III-B CRISPR-associated protein Cas10/Cmr2 [Actinomycetota bacterium]
MSVETFSRKLAAYLHDPVDKPFILMQGISHERRASELSERLGVRIEGVEAADHIASAMERAFLPKGASRNQAMQVKFLEDPCIKHPLSGRELEGAECIKGVDKKRFIDAADKAIEELAGKEYEDEKTRFLDLWRNLKPKVVKHCGGFEGKLWALAPADTRMPDHSIFEHSKIASACSRSGYADSLLLSNCSLMLFSIGGAQRFIAEARKAQDLFWGSYLLSFLNWKAIERISDLYGPDCVIFPDIHGQPFADIWLARLGIEVENSAAGELTAPSIPNRTLAIIPEKDEEELRNLGCDLDALVKKALCDIGNTVLEEFGIQEPPGFREQLKKSLNAYWVFLPWFKDDDESKAWQVAIDSLGKYLDPESIEAMRSVLGFAEKEGEYSPNIGNVYSLLYSFCEKTAGSLKNMNYFEQLTEQGRKCSLCGERNVLFYKKGLGEEALEDDRLRRSKLFNGDAVIFDVENSQVTPKFLQPGEGLCAVCFSKRGAERYFRRELGKQAIVEFPSIAEVTLRKAINILHEENAYQEYTSLFGDDYDPQLLYEENLTERFFEKNGLDVGMLETAKNALEKLLRGKKVKTPKYYAVVKLDGDDMGKWLSGELAPLYGEIYHPRVWQTLDAEFKAQLERKKRPLTPAMHATISSALKDYSQVMVKELVTVKHDGYLIYAGGDDALALVNLDDLFDLMTRLRGAFSGHIDGSLEKVDFSACVSGFVERDERILLTMGPGATASMGVCISHYRTPLSMVMEAVREAEEKAKSLPGKNAFSITVLKGSGERMETTWKWFYQDGVDILRKGGTAAMLKELADALKGAESKSEAGFSDRFVYKFKETFQRFNPEERIPHLDEMIASETRRLLKRSFISRKKDDVRRDALIEGWTAGLKSLYLNAGSLGNFISMLETAAFIAREP